MMEEDMEEGAKGLPALEVNKGPAPVQLDKDLIAARSALAPWNLYRPRLS